MKEKIIIETLKSASKAEKIALKKHRSLKSNIFKEMKANDIEVRNNLILEKLTKYFSPCEESGMLAMKSKVMQEIYEIEKSRQWNWSRFMNVFVKKSSATVFAVVLLATIVAAPFQNLSYLDVLPKTKAVFLECVGTVYLNGNICKQGELSLVSPGDDIKTTDRSLANIFYPNYQLVRINKASEALLSDESTEDIHLESGSIWLNAPAVYEEDNLKISTPILRTRLPKGSVGLSTEKNTTQVYTSTASIDVQIENRIGSTEIISIPPDKNVLIKKSRRNALVKEPSLDGESMEWLSDNKEMDVEYSEIVKERAFDDAMDEAGVSENTMTTYVSKLTDAAVTALTWDDANRKKLDLSKLNKMFASMLISLGEGDQTIAMSTYKAYRKKIISLVAQSSDIMLLENPDVYDNKPLELLKKHISILSLFSQDDSEYVLKDRLRALSLEISNLTNSHRGEEIAGVISQQLLEAHSKMTDGRIDLAAEILRKISLQEDVIVDSNGYSINSNDAALLSEIAEKSPILERVVSEIKMKKVDKLRAINSGQDKNEQVSASIRGRAHKEIAAEKSEKSEETMSVKIVGKAVKQSEEIL